MALVGLVQLLGQATLCLRRNPLSGKPRCTPTAVVFNTAQFMLAAGLAGLAYFAWFPHSAPAPLGRVENLWAIPTAAAAMYLVNSWAVAIMIGLQRHTSSLAVWLKGRGADLLQFGALFALGLCMALLASHYSWALLLFVAPGVFVHASLRRSLRLLASEAAARAEADRAVASRDQFISIAAHELKNPLAGLLGYTQLLLRDGKDGRSRSPEELRETLQVIGQQGQKLDRLIGTLLDSKRIETGKLALERAPTDVAKVVHDAVATARIGERDQPFVVRAPSSIVADVDPLRLGQVLGNLLDNALKYNRPGEPIEVEVAQAPPPPAGS